MSVLSFLFQAWFLHKTATVILNFALLLGIFAGWLGVGGRLREQISCFWLFFIVAHYFKYRWVTSCLRKTISSCL
jgi:hypothetical protein